MFRAVISGISTKFTPILSNFVNRSVLPARAFSADNNAIIVGSIITSMRRSSGSNQKVVIIETKDVASRSQIHTVVVQTKQKLDRGTRILATGTLRSRKVPAQNNKVRDVSKLFADSWSILDADDNCSKDQNSIHLRGRIASDITSKENHSIFAVAHHLSAGGGKNAEDKTTEFHTVFAFDANLLHSLRTTFKKGDSIYVTGYMKTNSFYNETGERKRSGMIVADRIYKRASLEQIKSAQTASKEAKLSDESDWDDDSSDMEAIDDPSKVSKN